MALHGEEVDRRDDNTCDACIRHNRADKVFVWFAPLTVSTTGRWSTCVELEIYLHYWQFSSDRDEIVALQANITLHSLSSSRVHSSSIKFQQSLSPSLASKMLPGSFSGRCSS